MQGDKFEETFTDEEKAALGEAEAQAPAAEKAEPAAKGPDTQDGRPKGDEPPKGEQPPKGEEPPKTEPKTAEPTAEEQAAAEEMGFKVQTDDKGKVYVVDEDGTRIPPARWSKIYRDAKEGERTKDKLDLIKKIGPDEYYRIYPDETPAGYKPAAAPAKSGPQPQDPLKLVATYQDPEHPYHGKTLAEIYEVDPAEGRKLEKAWDTAQAAQPPQRQPGEIDPLVMKEAEKEIFSFQSQLSADLFSKEVGTLSDAEKERVNEAIQSTLAWMAKTGRGGGVIADAYFLMNKEGLIKKASSRAAEKAIKDLTEKKGPPSIDTGSGGDVKGTGYEAYEQMTEDQLTDAIDKMSDAKAAQFFKTTPQSIQKKYPGLPWG